MCVGGGGCVERVCVERVSWRGCVCWEDVCGGYDVSWRGVLVGSVSYLSL